jgi:hypothetical protein
VPTAQAPNVTLAGGSRSLARSWLDCCQLSKAGTRSAATMATARPRQSRRRSTPCRARRWLWRTREDAGRTVDAGAQVAIPSWQCDHPVRRQRLIALRLRCPGPARRSPVMDVVLNQKTINRWIYEVAPHQFVLPPTCDVCGKSKVTNEGVRGSSPRVGFFLVGSPWGEPAPPMLNVGVRGSSSRVGSLRKPMSTYCAVRNWFS